MHCLSPTNWHPRLAWALVGLFLLAGASHGQTFTFHHYTAFDGLPQAQVFAVEQDVDGYLWLGTYSGLGRYNGREFESYSRSDGLAANVVQALAIDASGRLWAGTTSGLCRYLPGEDRFECLEGNGFERVPVNVLLAESGGRLWVGTDRGLFRVEGEEFERVDGHSLLVEAAIQSLARGEDGGLWVGTSAGLLHRLPKVDQFEQVYLPKSAEHSITALHADARSVLIGTPAGLFRYRRGHVLAVAEMPRIDVNAIRRDARGALWVATSQGVIREQDGEYRWLRRVNGLRNEITHTVFVDREGLVWLGHDDGLSKWVPGPFVGYLTEHGLLDNFVRTIAEDAAARLWLGTRSGVQVVERSNRRWDFSESMVITTDQGLPDNRVYSIDFPASDQALIATSGGVARWQQDAGIVEVLTDADGLPSNSTQAVLVDHSGGAWIGTNLGTVFLDREGIRPVADPALARAYAYRIRQDVAGRVWFATRDHGLFVLSGGEVARIGAEQGLSGETLWDLAPSSDGGMWVGSNGDGLFHVQADGRTQRFDEADGLANNFVWQVLEDSRGEVWAYTNQGLSRLGGRGLLNFGSEHGLLHPEGGATGAWESEDGQLWFASAEGLMRYDPDYESPLRRAPAIVIERVTSDGAVLGQGSMLPAGSGSVNVEFAALSYWNEASLEYRYRLLGAGENWSEPVVYRPVTFGNLSGGQYRFEVQARHPGGAWTSQPAHFEFGVRPAYWTTLWFWSLMLLAAGLLTWALILWRLRADALRRRELQAQVAERTRELEAANRKLEAASITDPLTGLHNRRFLLDQIQSDVALARRAYIAPDEHPNRDIVFMMVDIDHFKEVNDTHGHLAGDQVLRGYSKILRKQLRTSDYVVRWGGEEFLVVARQTEAWQLHVIAERMIEEVRRAVFMVDGVEDGLQCTCSIGISRFPFVSSTPDALNWEQVVDAADTAIYLAKELGRDGWVAIHGTEKANLRDATAFMQRLKNDLAGLVAAGEVVIESSFPDPCGHGEEHWIQRPGGRS